MKVRAVVLARTAMLVSGLLMGFASLAWADCRAPSPPMSKYQVPAGSGPQVSVPTGPSKLARNAGSVARLGNQKPSPVTTPANSIPRVDMPGSGSVATNPVFKAKAGMQRFMLPYAPSVAAVWQPQHQRIQAYMVDATGTLKEIWRQDDGFWAPSLNRTGRGFAPAGAPVAAVYQPLHEHLEVFTIGPDGSLRNTWQGHDASWSRPGAITGPFASPCSQLAAVWQPLNEQLEVFAVDATGAIRGEWKQHDGPWSQPFNLTGPGIAPPGAPIAAVWQPLNEQLEVFVVDNNGAIRGVRKEHNGAWKPSSNLTGPGFARSGAGITAVWQPLNEQLEVFTVDSAGAVKGVWKAHNSAWKAPFEIYRAGFARPGAPLVSVWSPPMERLDVLTIGIRGELLHAYKWHNGTWRSEDPVLSPGFSTAGAPLAAVWEPLNDLTEVFTLSDAHEARIAWTSGYGTQWQGATVTRANVSPIYGVHAAYCTNILREWSKGDEWHLDALKSCEDFMGITAHCAKMDAIPMTDYPPKAERPRFLKCVSRYHSEDVLEQGARIAEGIEKGFVDAMVAAAPFFGIAVEAYGCVDGVLFACGVLAVDVGNRLDVIPPEVKQAANLVTWADDCVGGDILSCARLGAAGASAAGVNIPGEDAAEVTAEVLACKDESFDACLKLGERAAGAAGVPVDDINKAATDANNCYAGDLDACTSLGEDASHLGIPVGGVPQGVNDMKQCSYGDVAACQRLGQALAAAPK